MSASVLRFLLMAPCLSGTRRAAIRPSGRIGAQGGRASGSAGAEGGYARGGFVSRSLRQEDAVSWLAP